MRVTTVLLQLTECTSLNKQVNVDPAGQGLIKYTFWVCLRTIACMFFVATVITSVAVL